MVSRVYTHARLMEASEARVEMAAAFDSPADTLVASPYSGTPRKPIAAGKRSMIASCAGVSGQTHLDSQVMALRSTALSLLHRKAIFDYLRYREITGRKRHRFFTVFYGSRDYVNAVLAEHGNYVRCSSSYLWHAVPGRTPDGGLRPGRAAADLRAVVCGVLPCVLRRGRSPRARTRSSRAALMEELKPLLVQPARRGSPGHSADATEPVQALGGKCRSARRPGTRRSCVYSSPCRTRVKLIATRRRPSA